MTVGELRRRKQELKYTYRQISDLSGLPVGTVQKILGGITKSPRYDSMQALERVLVPEQAPKHGEKKEIHMDYYSPLPEDGNGAPSGKQSVLMEAGSYGAELSAPPGTEHTLEDYLALPDERRVELIDGAFYDMAAPTVQHQRLIAGIFRQLDRWAFEKHTGCEVLISPLDVQLDDPDRNADPKRVRTIVEPDILVICQEHRDRIGEMRVFGAPDFVIEIVSPSSRKKDMTLKLSKYQEAGVREYWVVDPYREKVIVYTWGDEPDVAIYGFGQEIPVAVSGGECCVRI